MVRVIKKSAIVAATAAGLLAIGSPAFAGDYGHGGGDDHSSEATNVTNSENTNANVNENENEATAVAIAESSLLDLPGLIDAIGDIIAPEPVV